jgi:hypothetical protein
MVSFSINDILFFLIIQRITMSFIIGLFLGCILGAVAQYYLQQHRDTRQHSELIVDKNNQDMVHLFAQYPYLMNLIKSHINDQEYQEIREFFVVDPSAIMNSSVPRLRYDFSDEMLLLLEELEALDYIDRLEHDSLLYRMEEEFIEDVQQFVVDDSLYEDKSLERGVLAV